MVFRGLKKEKERDILPDSARKNLEENARLSEERRIQEDKVKRCAKEMHRIRARRNAAAQRKMALIEGAVDDKTVAYAADIEAKRQAALRRHAAHIEKQRLKAEKRAKLPRRQKRVIAAVEKACADVEKVFEPAQEVVDG